MAIYNTPSDSANTGVRAFLTKVGELYLERSFNTGSGQGKKDWIRIKESVFGNRCAYCGATGVPLSMEHLVMFNRDQCGLHHPGNIVPACSGCNSSRNRDTTWEQHLKIVCNNRNESDYYTERKNKITTHIRFENFPKLNKYQLDAIKVIAESLYNNIKIEGSKSLELYLDIQKKFVD